MLENFAHEVELQSGVVLVWADRHQIGRYGYLTPLRASGFGEKFVYFFDESSLIQPNEQIFPGAVVKYSIDSRTPRPTVEKIQLEKFELGNHELDFEEDDFLGSLEREWFGIVDNPKSPVAKHLNQLLSLDSSKYYGPGYDRDRRGGFPSDLERRLNKAIGDPLQYDKYLFSKIKLRNQTKLLLSKKPKGLALRFLNRLLLEDAFIHATSSKNKFPDSSSPVVKAEVVEIGDEDGDRRYGRLKTPYKPSLFFFSHLPSDTLIPPVGSIVECRIFAESDQPETIAYDVWEIPSDRQHLVFTSGSKNATTEITGAKSEDDRDGKTPPRKLIPPLQFDFVQESLISSNKISSSPLPLRFAFVLKEFFDKSSNLHKSTSAKSLSYREVALAYKIGGFKQSRPGINKQDIQTRLENQKVLEKPDFFAHQFARDFRRWLNKRGVPSDALVACDRKSQTYHLVSSGWHESKPVIGNSEASLISMADPEFTPRKNRRTGSTDEHDQDFDEHPRQDDADADE